MSHREQGGTRRGYVLHREADEEACTECLVANAAYQRDYRKRNHGRDRARARARDAALSELSREYPQRYMALLVHFRNVGGCS